MSIRNFIIEELIMEEKRRFSRIFFATDATLTFSDRILSTKLHDLSFKGALISCDEDITNHKGNNCALSFSLEGSDVSISASGHIAHVENSAIGIEFSKMGIESISHLRRLIELNLGDEDLLNRELDSLTID